MILDVNKRPPHLGAGRRRKGTGRMRTWGRKAPQRGRNNVHLGARRRRTYAPFLLRHRKDAHLGARRHCTRIIWDRF